jgi:hypothetical protein
MKRSSQNSLSTLFTLNTKVVTLITMLKKSSVFSHQFSAKNERGYIPVVLVLTVTMIIMLSTYAGTQTQRFKDFYSQKSPEPSPAQVESTPSPSPSEQPSPSPSPVPSPSPSPTPKPSQTPKPSTTAAATGGGGIQTERGNFRATVVTLPISARMVTDTANDSDCSNDCPTKSLADFVSQNGGYAGINGTYFCPPDYAECGSKKSSFDNAVYNSRLSKWLNEGHRGWNGLSMIYQDGSGYHYLQNSNSFGGGLNAGIVNYPGILNNGQITVEANTLSEKQASKGTKGGIGFNTSNVFLVIAYGVDMSDFAAVFKALGAQYALNLDGGGSAALYNGGYKAGPGRTLPNAIIFK